MVSNLFKALLEPSNSFFDLSFSFFNSSESVLKSWPFCVCSTMHLTHKYSSHVFQIIRICSLCNQQLCCLIKLELFWLNFSKTLPKDTFFCIFDKSISYFQLGHLFITSGSYIAFNAFLAEYSLTFISN